MITAKKFIMKPNTCVNFQLCVILPFCFQLRPFEEPASPITPPPNYDAALMILAQSAESVLNKTRYRQTSLVRRSLSVDQVQERQSQPNSPRIMEATEEHDIKSNRTKSNKSVFRFSGKFVKRLNSFSSGAKNQTDSSQCQSSLLTPPPPYPQTPSVYPNSPPPPFTPTVPEIQIHPAVETESSDNNEVVS